MRKIWIILPLGLALAIGMIGYFGYRAIKNTLTIPEELAPYESTTAAMKLIKSKAPAPGPEARLTAKQVDLFIGMLDSINAGSDQMAPAIESLHLDTTKKGGKKPNVLAVPGVVHQALMMAPLTRRAIVNYLNDHGMSWAEYRWIKERVLAASGITAAEADSSSEFNAPASDRALRKTVRDLADTLKANESRSAAKVKARVNETDSTWDSDEDADSLDRPDPAFDDDSFDDNGTYTYLDDLRLETAPDAAEIALVKPHRELLLRRALKCMQGRDDEF